MRSLVVLVALIVAACSVSVPPTAQPPTSRPTQTSEPLPTAAPASLAATSSPGPSPTAAISADPFAPGPPITRTIEVDSREIHAPIPGAVSASGIWTGTEMIVWGGWNQEDGTIGISGVSGRGAAYDPVTDVWRRIDRAPIAPRAAHLAVWTGGEMIIWGGFGESGGLADGALYDPDSDTWRNMAPVPADLDLDMAGAFDGELEFVEAMAGDEWIVGYKGGDNDFFDVLRVAAYSPTSNEWRRLPDAQVSRTDVVDLEWTGGELVLGHFEGFLRLEPIESTAWEPLAPTRSGLSIRGPMAWVDHQLFAAMHRFDASGVWAFLEAWDPSVDMWSVVTLPPHSIAYGTLLADDKHVIAFGTGLAYDIASDGWWDARTFNPNDREGHVLVWTGHQAIVWGGWVCGKCPQGAFDNGIVLTPEW